MNDKQRAYVATELARIELENLETLVAAYEELHELANRLLKIEGRSPVEFENVATTMLATLNQYRTVLVGLETA